MLHVLVFTCTLLWRISLGQKICTSVSYKTYHSADFLALSNSPLFKCMDCLLPMQQTSSIHLKQMRMENVFVQTRKTATQIDNQHTDIAIFQFEDKLFIIVTQFEKIGTMVLATPAKGISDNSNPVYQIKVLFGIDEVQTHAFARFLATKLNLSQPLLLGLAFKEKNISALAAQKIVSLISDGIQKTSLK